MDDLSLEELQAALEDVQEQKPATRLSERNVVELINKLREVGLLGADLLHSVNGREYITTAQLCKEVERSVVQSGGRIAVVDLPAQLGVDVTHCERQAVAAVEQSGGRLQLIQGELLSEGYFDSVATELNELLQEASVLSFAQIAHRFRLSAELVRSTIESRLDSTIDGRVDAGILYTSMYFDQIKAMLRGALRGAIAPVNLGSLVKRWDLHTSASTAKTVAALVEELVAEGAVSGSLMPGASVYTPSSYVEAQRTAARDFFAQNAYVEYSMLERMGFAEGRAFMAAACPNGVALGAVFVGPQLRAQLDAAVDEVAAAGSWLDARTVLPAALGVADAGRLLVDSLAATRAGLHGSSLRIVDGTCVVSDGQMEALRSKALALARDAAELDLQRRRQSASAASASTPAAASAGGGSQSAAKKPAPDEDGSDDDWDVGKGKKKKGGRRRGGPKPKAAVTAQPAKATKAKPGGQQQASLASDMLTLEALAGKVEEWLPDAAGAGELGAMCECLAADLRAPALEAFESALAAVFLAGAEMPQSRRRRREAIARLLEESLQRLHVYEHGAELASGDEALSAALSRHLLRGLGQQALDLVLRCQEVDAREGRMDGPEASSPQSLSAPLAPAERATLMKALPPDVAKSAAAAEKALGGTDTAAALEALRAAAGAVGLPPRRVDKKAEKALVAEHRAMLREKLRSQQAAAEVLSLAVPLLLAKIHGRALSIPGKALAGAIELLRGDLEAPAFELLSEFHVAVVQSLRAHSQAENPELTSKAQAVKLMAGVEDAEA